MPDGPSPRGWSRIEQFQACEQYWSYQVLGIPELGIPTVQPKVKADYFTIGSAFHEGMKARFRGGTLNDMMVAALDIIERDCAAYENLAEAHDWLVEYIATLLAQYCQRRGAKREFEPLMLSVGGAEPVPAVEIEFPMTLPQGTEMTVRIDLVTTYGGHPVVPEHKTTSRDFVVFFQEFVLDAKCTGYLYALRKSGDPQVVEANKILINAVKKPRKNAKVLEFDFDVNLTERSEAEFERWAFESEYLMRQMDDVRERRRPPIRRTKNCVDSFGKVCPYHGLCKYGPRVEMLARYRTTQLPKVDEVNGGASDG